MEAMGKRETEKLGYFVETRIKWERKGRRKKEEGRRKKEQL